MSPFPLTICSCWEFVTLCHCAPFHCTHFNVLILCFFFPSYLRLGPSLAVPLLIVLVLMYSSCASSFHPACRILPAVIICSHGEFVTLCLLYTTSLYSSCAY